MKIENGRWLVSLDYGISWEDVGQATGESGKTPVFGKFRGTMELLGKPWLQPVPVISYLK